MSERGTDIYHTSSQRYFENQTFFAQLLLAGTSSLYVYKDTALDKEHFLFEFPKDTFIELLFKRNYIDTNNLRASDDDYTYQIQRLSKGCTSIIDKKIKDAGFNDISFIRLGKAYNNCQNPNAGNNYEYTPEKTKAIFGVDLSLTHTNITISGLGTTAINFKPSYSIDAGIFLNLVGPRTQKRFAVYNELLFSHYAIRSDPYYPGSFELKQTELKASYLKLFNAVRYQFPSRRATPYLQIGLVISYTLAGSTNTSVKSTVYHQPTTTEQLMPFGKFERGITGGLGICLGKFEAECRYEIGSGFSTYQDVSTTSMSLLFLLKRALF